MLPRTAAQVLMPPDGAFKTHTSLRETLNQADLDLPYFRTTEQNSPGWEHPKVCVNLQTDVR